MVTSECIGNLKYPPYGIITDTETVIAGSKTIVTFRHNKNKSIADKDSKKRGKSQNRNLRQIIYMLIKVQNLAKVLGNVDISNVFKELPRNFNDCNIFTVKYNNDYSSITTKSTQGN